MIYAGQPERVQARRDWAAWELEYAGFPELARELADEIDTQRASAPS
ncbi:hypothetical protein ACIO6T_30560 [Streptomyces sp. NPDC087532]